MIIVHLVTQIMSLEISQIFLIVPVFLTTLKKMSSVILVHLDAMNVEIRAMVAQNVTPRYSI